VADDVDLAELGERGRPLAADPGREGCRRVADDRADRRLGRGREDSPGAGTESSKMIGSSQRAWWKRRGVGF
jgi:hypothetical protein